MYTLEQLQQKTFKELKEIGWQLNVLPAGDRRCRQNWIDALVGVNPPLLELLEASPGVEVDRVQESIEIQAQEPIAQVAETSPGVSPVENFTEADRPPNRGDSRGRRESKAKVSQSAIAPDAKFSPGIELDPSRAKQQWITFSARFLALYPPYFGEVNYKADATGQLNLLEPDIEDEPPDPDDFESLDAFREAIGLWDSEHCEPSSEHCGFSSEHNEPLSVLTSLDSMCEWAPCPLEWYEPETNEINETVSRTLEVSPIAISDTSEFSIPTFDAWCDRQNDTDEPPDTGIFARLPAPKPPKFPPRAINQLHDSYINSAQERYCITYCMTAAGSSQSGRSPPGGDVMN